MMELTKERLQQIVHAAGLEPCDHEEVFDSITVGEIVMMARQLLAGLEQEPVGITDRSEIEGLKRGEMANVMPPDFKGVDAGDEVLLYAAPQLPQPAVVSEKMIDTFEAEFRRAFEVSPEVEQMLEIGYQGEKFSLSIRDAATWWKLGPAAMLHGAEPVSQPYTLPNEINCKQAYCMMHSTSLAGCYRDGWNDCRTVMLEAAPQQETK